MATQETAQFGDAELVHRSRVAVFPALSRIYLDMNQIGVGLAGAE